MIYKIIFNSRTAENSWKARVPWLKIRNRNNNNKGTLKKAGQHAD